MSGASGKARYYLERAIPELRELERLKIFSSNEVSVLAKKRADFEHKVNARGSQPADYARYIAWEMDLEKLRKIRVARQKVNATTYSGQRQIFFLLERATRKFYGDLGLWMTYIEYARKEKAHKKAREVLTKAIRLHLGKAELWIYGAKYVLEVHADMAGARTYLQRGLAFCRRSTDLWIEYARLEMIYVAKTIGRIRVLGLDPKDSANAPGPAEPEFAADLIALPSMDDEELALESQGMRELDEGRASADFREGSMSQIVEGSIPRAIYTAAMKQFCDDHAVAELFFDLFAEFYQVPCALVLIQQVLDDMLVNGLKAPLSLGCYIRRPLIGVFGINTAEYAAGMRECLSRLRISLRETSAPVELAETAIGWMLSILRQQHLDQGIRKAVLIMLQRVVDEYGPQVLHCEDQSTAKRKEKSEKLSEELHKVGIVREKELHKVGGVREKGVGI
ncbi:MAG: U3 snoRNP protein [Phylliscum demangeonii]|nr:MAG: U3 snoRNP protein [Phylliscum demangeonii]